MITFEEARKRCDARIRPLALAFRELDDAALLCSGTDVSGPELVEQIKRDLEEFRQATLSTTDVSALVGRLSGLFVRIFWLGFEFGKAEE